MKMFGGPGIKNRFALKGGTQVELAGVQDLALHFYATRGELNLNLTQLPTKPVSTG
jgi:hypothetical protein